MMGWAATFLVLAIFAAVLLVFSGIAGIAATIAWVLFVFGLILAAVSVLLGRRFDDDW